MSLAEVAPYGYIAGVFTLDKAPPPPGRGNNRYSVIYGKKFNENGKREQMLKIKEERGK
jgi:hypothetical protein